MFHETQPYIADILSQPRVLRAAVSCQAAAEFKAARAAIRAHERVVLTGMGASHAALLPAWRMLIGAGIAAWHLDTAELLSLGTAFLTPKTLVLAASQSGRSAEVVTLTQRIPRSSLIALTNEPQSPLAQAAGQVMEIRAEKEHAVSTRSYVNTLALATSIAAAAAEARMDDDWLGAANAMETYLASWRARVEALKAKVGMPQRMVFLARDASIAAALYGALITKEAAKWPVEAMNAAQFRHGPLELADERLTAVVLAGGDPTARERNLRLAKEIERYGGRVFWVDGERQPELRNLEIPPIRGSALAVLEILPLQLLSIALAEQSGIEPGAFRHLQKVTVIE